ncbi:hypothetical protein BGY98DRAFT_926537 [Russula aff. rugulosa BPL654]|nr:hypothetical protein BGY98DRAFT_926537 [Russula aff. rugulosa BPL654]
MLISTADWNQVPPISTAQFPLATSAQEDSKNDSEMWNMYLDEVKEEDGRITNAWNNDANNIVTFTSLLSAIIGIFIIEFYKKLSPDSGDQTVALLQQISHQLPNSPTTSAYSNSANQPSPPGTAMVWVNALWLISLVLSLTCALMATLLQQWGHRYAETPKSTTMLRHRVRVRSLLLVGTRKYNIPLIVEILPTLLHLSVYLFLSGLVIAFHTIHKTVAIVVNVAVGVSVLAYIYSASSLALM